MPKLVENALLVYTDGSLYPKGRKGGYGVVFVHVSPMGEETIVLEHSPPGIRGATGNRMELQACIDGLTMAPSVDCFQEVDRIVIRTDSRYVVNYHVRALGSWRNAGWKNWQGRPIDNADLWKKLGNAQGKIRKKVVFEWVKGHAKGKAKDPYNARADTLAKESAKNPLSRNIFRSSVRRKIGPGQTKQGSVGISGQTMVIFVMEVLRMRVQKTWKYRYQVASKTSADYHAIDWIYSSEQMRDGHYYEVQVNSDIAHPQVIKLVREIAANELTT
jgi:ribonuclease HI